MKVLVEGNNTLIQEMFYKRGYSVVRDTGMVRDLSDVDLVCFEGGADVTPYLYGEANTHSHSNEGRDFYSICLYQQAKMAGVRMVGICRGGQFLNVMGGGKMIQDYSGHAIRGTHEILFDLEGKETCSVTSTHHQVMVPDLTKQVLVGWAGGDWQGPEQPVEAEIVWNSKDLSLSFQPHPEYVGSQHECQVLFFRCLKHFFGL